MRWKNVYNADQSGIDTVSINEYLDKLYPYLNICENKRILEIGPFNGIHTQVVKSYNPKKITLVELLLKEQRLLLYTALLMMIQKH